MKILTYIYFLFKRLVFFLLNKFYLFIAISLIFLLCLKFTLQNVSNKITKLEQYTKVIMIDISHKEAKIGEITINYMQKNIGKNININEISSLKANPIKPKPWWKRLFSFFFK